MILLSFTGCKKDNLKSSIPSYIYINEITLTTNYATEGTANEKIVDAWVYLDDNLVGVYELPVKFPVLASGNHKIQIRPGIKENGVSNTRKIYPFYNTYEAYLTLTPNKIDTIYPTTTYRSNTVFEWMEDFENPGISFTYHSNSDTIFEKVNDANTLEGVNSGKVYLETTMDFFEAHSPVFSNMNASANNPVYLEINFKNNVPVLTGMYVDNTQLRGYYLNTTTTWNKVYLNLTDMITENPQASAFKFYIGYSKQTSTVSNPEFYIDNIKLVHF